MRLLVIAVLVAAVTGAAVLTGAETKGLRGSCSDGPQGGNCVTERFVQWDGPLLVPLVLGALVVLALAVWIVRRAAKWLTLAVVATVAAGLFAVVSAL
jgi:hypothetical protein